MAQSIARRAWRMESRRKVSQCGMRKALMEEERDDVHR